MIWPDSTTRDMTGRLVIGGVSISDLADQFGTPIYVFDAGTIRGAARAFRGAFTDAYGGESRVVYAAKAFLNPALIGMLVEEGLGLDVVSGGELFVGIRAGMPAAEMTFHGNNKSLDELGYAIESGVGRIVIDNAHELDLLDSLTRDHLVPQSVMIRVNPGVDVHTHHKISTGIADSKFGLPIADGQAEAAVRRTAEVPGLRLVGYHAHVGSQLQDPDAHIEAIAEMLQFAAWMRDRYDVEMGYFSPGGGFGIAYDPSDRPPATEDWAARIACAVETGCDALGLRLPVLIIEPGRSIAGRAGVAVYSVGAIKRLAGIRTYVSVDGGMADNIRPSLYGASYIADIANREHSGSEERVSIAGKYCESGDILIENIMLPKLHAGDLLAVPAAGAYTLAMESNYNMALRPAVVMIEGGRPRVIRRRETFDDLVRLDAPEVRLTNQRENG